MEKNRVRITTTVDEDLKLLAQKYGITFSVALDVGIKKLLEIHPTSSVVKEPPITEMRDARVRQEFHENLHPILLKLCSLYREISPHEEPRKSSNYQRFLLNGSSVTGLSEDDLDSLAYLLTNHVITDRDINVCDQEQLVELIRSKR